MDDVMMGEWSQRLQAAYGCAERWTADGGYATPAEWVTKLVEVVAPEMAGPDDLPAAARFAFADDVPVSEEAGTWLKGERAAGVLAEFARRLAALERAEPEPIAALFKELRATLKEQWGLRGRDVMMPLRAALTGRIEGPCLEIVVCLLGRRRTLDRLQALPLEVSR